MARQILLNQHIFVEYVQAAETPAAHYLRQKAKEGHPDAAQWTIQMEDVQPSRSVAHYCEAISHVQRSFEEAKIPLRNGKALGRELRDLAKLDLLLIEKEHLHGQPASFVWQPSL